MARSINTIYNSMLAAHTANPSLSELNSTSSTAVYKLLYYIVATIINIHEQYWDLFKTDLEYIKDSTPVMTELWWIDKLTNFYQYDNTDTDKGVVKIDEKYIPYYTTIDDTKHIIKYCSLSTYTNLLNIKLAKADVDGNPVELDSNEIGSVTSFINEIQSAGTNINVTSIPPDNILITCNIFYNGQFVESNVKDAVKQALRSYLLGLKFDGSIHVQKIIDNIQTIASVTDVEILTIGGKQYSDTNYLNFTRIYTTAAGYATLDETNSIFNMIIEK